MNKKNKRTTKSHFEVWIFLSLVITISFNLLLNQQEASLRDSTKNDNNFPTK